MSRVIVLDTGPLGLVTNPSRSVVAVACAQWLQELIRGGARVLLPEIADYELRRELRRAGKTQGIANLDALGELLEYVPITTAAMRKAAELWAIARQQGAPTAGDKTIDGDVILVAQTLTLGLSDAVVATTNVGHLARLIPAQLWNEIRAD